MEGGRLKEEIQSINLCPHHWFHRGGTRPADNESRMKTTTHRYNLSSHVANGCATVSPVIKLYVSFHQGDRRRGQMRREDVEGIQERQERQRWGREIMYLMHPPCDFLPLSNLFLSSGQTTWHLVALKFYWGEINWPKNSGASLISLNMLFAPYSHAVSLIFSSFHSRFHSLHFSPLLPPPCSCLCLPPSTTYWILTRQFFSYLFLFSHSISLTPTSMPAHLLTYPPPSPSPLFRHMHISPGTTGNTTWSCQSCCIASDSRFPPGLEKSFRRSAALNSVTLISPAHSMRKLKCPHKLTSQTWLQIFKFFFNKIQFSWLNKQHLKSGFLFI